MNATKNVTCTILIGLTLIVQLMSPTQVYADGETPPPTTEFVATGPNPDKPGVDILPTEVSPTEEAATPTPESPDKPAMLTDPTPVPIGPTPAEVILSPRVPGTSDVLQSLPEQTRVIVLDNIGKPLPLASRAAAQAIAESDPVWCPAGQAPTPGANGCTISYLTLADLVANEGASIAANGTIWITTGPVPDLNPILIDGSIYNTWANYELTLQGGWDGIAGSTTIGSNSVFTAPIAISTWVGNVTINNLTVQNTNGTGLYIETSGTIAANNIVASGNGQHGAELRGMSGVTVNGINEFSNNGSLGLWADSNGNVTLNSVTANGNAWMGALLYSYSGNITLTGTNELNNNWNGLHAEADGDITMNQVTANGNASTGVSLYNFSGNITLTGTNEFNNNAENGLWVDSYGDITLNSITANGNGLLEAYAGVSLYSRTGNVTLTGTNEFNNNGNGLSAYSIQGDITANNVTANGNGWMGSGYVGAELYSYSGNITLTGTNEFNNNVTIGLRADSHGVMTLNSVTANGNGWMGAFIRGYSGLAVNGTNEFSNNADYGLVVFSDRNADFTLNNVNATGNRTDVYLFTPGNVTINSSTVLSLDVTAVCGILALNQVSAANISYPVSGEHTVMDPLGETHTIYCDPRVYIDGILLGELPVVPAQYEFDLSCDSQTLYPVDLPNGDKVTIVCPVSGRALISRLDNTTIPNDLPAGYTYASAFSVSILQEDEPIPVITEGGHVEVSFQVPSQQEGTYSILFWDNGTWVPLSDFILGTDNNPQSFDLNPGITTDLRTILSGVRVVTRNGVQRVEVSTNFPGIFTLAQH